jgi:hypothetical protein
MADVVEPRGENLLDLCLANVQRTYTETRGQYVNPLMYRQGPGHSSTIVNREPTSCRYRQGMWCNSAILRDISLIFSDIRASNS